MSMGKSELTNISKLLKMRLRDCKGIRTAGILLGLLFIWESYMIISMITTYQDHVDYLSLGIFSDLAIAILAFVILYYTFQYGEYNEKHQIFPQTNTTHFVAFELYCYLTNLFIQALALLLFLLQYLLCFIFTRVEDNVHLACAFSISFLLTGFLVSLAYSFLYTALIILAATLIRRLRWWALALYAVILVALWITRDRSIASAVINFYAKETSPALFFIKVIATILIAIIISHIINPGINSIKALKFNYAQLIIIIFLLISFLQNLLMQTENKLSDSSYVTDLAGKAFDDYYGGDPECVLNAKSLDQGSKLYINYEVESSYSCYTETAKDNSCDDQIKVYIKPSKDIRNRIDLSSYTNPRLEASLKGDQLDIHVLYDKNVKLIGIAPYSTPMQFTRFKDKPYSTDYLWSSAGGYSGSIKVVLPENKKLIAKESITQSQLYQYY